MALDETRLANLIMDKMELQGLAPRNPLAGGVAIKLYTAIAQAIVEEIQNNADVVIPGGSSAGTYEVD